MQASCFVYGILLRLVLRLNSYPDSGVSVLLSKAIILEFHPVEHSGPFLNLYTEVKGKPEFK